MAKAQSVFTMMSAARRFVICWPLGRALVLRIGAIDLAHVAAAGRAGAARLMHDFARWKMRRQCESVNRTMAGAEGQDDTARGHVYWQPIGEKAMSRRVRPYRYDRWLRSVEPK